VIKTWNVEKTYNFGMLLLVSVKKMISKKNHGTHMIAHVHTHEHTHTHTHTHKHKHIHTHTSTSTHTPLMELPPLSPGIQDRVMEVVVVLVTVRRGWSGGTGGGKKHKREKKSRTQNCHVTTQQHTPTCHT